MESEQLKTDKHMTDKEKRKEAVAIISQMVADGVLSQETAEKYCPELKLSEDERIREALIGGLKDCIYSEWYDGVSIKECIAWLEKQGGKKLLLNDVREWLRSHVASYVNGEYNDFHHTVEYDGTFDTDRLIRDLTSEFESRNEQSSEWSEYDEDMRNRVVNFIPQHMTAQGYNEYIDWLDDFRYRVVPQPKQQWSEEDEKMRDSSTGFLCNLRESFGEMKWDKKPVQACIDWIMNLKPHWKPTEEHILALIWAFNNLPGDERKEKISDVIEYFKKLIK